MSRSATEPESAPGLPDRGPSANQPNPLSPRVFWLLLIVIATVAFIIRAYVGWKTFLDFDEWQHIFMASGARWADVAFELRTQAHPPLFFLLLRFLSRFSPGNPAIYRVFSIASGVGSVVLAALIARRISASPAIQLLCAAVFALSADAIVISDEIRSYQLAVFFVMLAFLSWFSMFPAPMFPTAMVAGPVRSVDKRPFAVFAVASTLAVLSHYSAVFFLGACLVVALLLYARPIMKFPGLFVAAFAVPFAVFAVQYFVHASAQPIQGYLFDFYRGSTPGESTLHFVVRNARNFFNLFSPVELGSTPAFLPVFLLLSAAVAWALGKGLRARSATGRKSAAAILFAITIVLELLIASLLQKYPFGGMLRHQYIAGPFVLIAAFAVLDSVVSLLGQGLQYAIAALVLAAGVVSLVEGPKLIQYPGLVLMQQEFKAWQTAFPNAGAVYLDHWGVMAYFIQTTDRPRTFVRRIPDDSEIDEYHVSAVSGDAKQDGTEIFYDKSRITLDLSDPAVYHSFASCLRASRAKELSLFFFLPGDASFPKPAALMEKLVSDRAAGQGLSTTKVVVAGTTLFAGFKLQESK